MIICSRAFVANALYDYEKIYNKQFVAKYCCICGRWYMPNNSDETNCMNSTCPNYFNRIETIFAQYSKEEERKTLAISYFITWEQFHKAMLEKHGYSMRDYDMQTMPA